jgi:hypothetical protein
LEGVGASVDAAMFAVTRVCAALAPMIKETVDSVSIASCSKHVIWNWLSFVKGLDVTDVDCIIDNSFLEANVPSALTCVIS